MAYTKKFLGGKNSKAYVVHDVNPYYSTMHVGDGSGNQISLSDDENLDSLQDEIQKHKKLKKECASKNREKMAKTGY